MPTLLDIEVNETVIIALLLFSAMISCVLLIYIFTRSRSGRVMSFFISGQILIVIWTVFYIFERLAPTVDIRWFIVRIEYFSLSYVGYVFMHFSYAYTRHKMMSKPWFYASLVLPTFNYVAIWTNDRHHLFYRGFSIDGEIFGPITYLTMATTFSYLLIGAIFFLSKRHIINLIRQRQSMYFVIAIVLPALVHGLQTAGLFQVGFALTHIVIPFSSLLFIVSVLKYQFLDVLPIAINETIDGMSEGMLVVHESGDVIDCNTNFFKKAFGFRMMASPKTVGDFMDEINKYVTSIEQVQALKESIHVDHNNPIAKGTLNVMTVFKREIIVYYTAKPLYDYGKHKVATLLTFFEMTEVYELSHELALKNEELTDANERLQKHIKTVQQLTTEKERNTIMAEIHDTLGHSMMELLTLLEVTDLLMEQNQDNVLETVEEAIEKARTSLKEVRSAVSRYKKMGGMI